MTNERIRELCACAHEYGVDGDPFDEFLANEGYDIRPKEQLTLGLFVDNVRGYDNYMQTRIEEYDDSYDHNIVPEIVRKAKKRKETVKRIDLMCSKGFIEQFKEVFSYANHGSEYNYNSYGANSPIGKEVLSYQGIKLQFEWFKK